MRISTKGRYGMAVMVKLAEEPNQWISTAKLSNDLGLSKIYLEQILTLLKSGNLVQSSKGPQGGYRINAMKVTAFDLLVVLEPALFEQEYSCGSDVDLQHTLIDHVFQPTQSSLEDRLKSITLESLVSMSRQKHSGLMFYI